MNSSSARLVVVLIAILAAGCQRNAPEEGRRADAADPKISYPAPRWPSYFKRPETVDELMPAAHSLVRNKSGFLGVGMGVLQTGETVLLVPNAASDPMVVEAIVKALGERGVKAEVKYTFELLGMTREQVDRQEQNLRKGRRIADAGIYRRPSGSPSSFRIPPNPRNG